MGTGAAEAFADAVGDRDGEKSSRDVNRKQERSNGTGTEVSVFGDSGRQWWIVRDSGR